MNACVFPQADFEVGGDVVCKVFLNKLIVKWRHLEGLSLPRVLPHGQQRQAETAEQGATSKHHESLSKMKEESLTQTFFWTDSRCKIV